MSIWTDISNLGAKETDSPDFLRKIHLVNQMCFLGATTSFLVAFQCYLFGNYYYAPIQFIASTLIGLFYFFNIKRHFNFSFYWIFSVILINTFYGSIEMQGIGLEYFFIPLGLAPFTIFENKKIYLGMVILSVVAFATSYFLRKVYLPHSNMSNYDIPTTFISNLVFVFILCATVIFQLKIVNSKYESIINEQKLIVENKNKDIIDSINYAKRIQHAKLPKKEEIFSALPQSFVLFKPKDIVSGDFYFFAPALKGEKTNSPLAPFRAGGDSFFIAAADCTGHGVPGALMSMIGSEKLNDAISQSSNPSTILNLLNKGIKTSLRQSDNDESTRDGMDIAFVRLDLSGSPTIHYAGANRPLWIIRKGQKEVEEIKATKMAIGGLTDDNQHFDTHELQLQQGDTIYIFTDGYADTFGGKNRKKLTTKKFKEILLDIQDKTIAAQEKYLDNFIEDWKVGTEQVDDILVIGLRL